MLTYIKVNCAEQLAEQLNQPFAIRAPHHDHRAAGTITCPLSYALALLNFEWVG
jgi:hypothetical protein